MSTLPPLYDRWMTTLLGAPVQPEPLSTCSSCAMCPGGGAGTRPVSRVVLKPELKCCTYTPTFPNYQVGGVLAEQGRGRDSMLARIGGGREVTPMGVGLSPEREGLDASLTSMTGVHAEQACAHLVQTDTGAGCSVWAHRDAVCSTWWCRYERGAVGLRFWWSLRFLLRGLEYALSLWCCLEEQIDPDALHLLMGLEGRPRGATVGNEVTRAQLWGRHVGQEEALYLRCHQRVKALSWEQALQVGGPEVRALARHVQTAWGRLGAPAPGALRVGQYMVSAQDETGAAVETYSPYDPLGVPAALVPRLHLFDGRPVEVVQEQLQREHGLSIDPSYLRALVDYGVLVAAG